MDPQPVLKLANQNEPAGGIINFDCSPDTAAVLQSPAGPGIVAMVEVGHRLVNFGMGMLSHMCNTKPPKAELEQFFIASSKAAQIKPDIFQLLARLQVVNDFAIALYEQAKQTSAFASIDEALRAVPIVFPENKMAMDTVPRNTAVIIVGAPKGAMQQLSDNMPIWPGFIMEFGDQNLHEIIKDEVRLDLLTIEDLEQTAGDIAKDERPGFDQLNAALRKCRRVTEAMPGVLVCFLSQANDALVDKLRELPRTRVVRWSNDFGPEVFFGGEIAQERLKQVVAAFNSAEPAEESEKSSGIITEA